MHLFLIFNKHFEYGHTLLYLSSTFVKYEGHRYILVGRSSV